jgi:hypothetical protein
MSKHCFLHCLHVHQHTHELGNNKKREPELTICKKKGQPSYHYGVLFKQMMPGQSGGVT